MDSIIPKSFRTYTVNSLRAEKSLRDNGLEMPAGYHGAASGVAPVTGEAPEGP